MLDVQPGDTFTVSFGDESIPVYVAASGTREQMGDLAGEANEFLLAVTSVSAFEKQLSQHGADVVTRYDLIVTDHDNEAVQEMVRTLQSSEFDNMKIFASDMPPQVTLWC